MRRSQNTQEHNIHSWSTAPAFFVLCLVTTAHGAAASPAAASAAAASDASAAAQSAAAQAAATEPVYTATAPEFTWFERNLASKCFAPKDAMWQLDDSSKETVLHRQTQFFGVYEQPEGFYYHYSTSTKQTEYTLVDGVKTQAAKPQRSSNTYRCQYGVRRSTAAVFGICYPSDATGTPNTDTAVPWPYTVYATTLKLLNPTTLQQTFSTLPAYEDLLAATPSGVKPGRQETVITYVIDGASGKVSMATKVNAFDVEPDSLEARFVGSQEPGVEHQVPCTYRHHHH